MSNPTTYRPSPADSTPESEGARRSGWLWIGFLVPLVALGVLVMAGQGDPDTSGQTGAAPEFSLPDAAGRAVSLDSILEGGDALIYFSMGVGCDGCFAQIPEAIEGLAARGLQLVPVMVDPPALVAAEAARFGITTPILIDASREVSEAYGMLGVYGHADRPSHSFALVRSDGSLGWMKHYATMFVPLSQLLSDIGA